MIRGGAERPSDEALQRKERAMTEPKTDTIDVPGAVLHYDVREADYSA